MELPFSLHSQQYLDTLREYRDLALEESHLTGSRKKLGAFTFGAAYASWDSEDGGNVMLVDHGLRRGSTTFGPIKQTKLDIMYKRGDLGFECIGFEMDLDDIGLIDIKRNFFEKINFFQVMIKPEFTAFRERRHGLHEPTDEDLMLLYTEMQRGATGLYATP